MPTMVTPSPEAAISAALSQDWKEAIRINTSLLKKDTYNIDALNRLGFAHLKSGQITRAKRIFQKVIKIDPYNQISLKNLKRLGNLKKKNLSGEKRQTISPLFFLEEPGKTKIASLINLAPSQILSGISPGQEVYLKAKNHVVEIRDEKHQYVGALPDDLSFRLIRLLTSGNRYQVVVKGTAKNALTVLIREVYRGKRYREHPSFAPSIRYFPLHPASAEISTPPSEEEESEG